MEINNQAEFLIFLRKLNDYDRRFQQLVLNRNQYELFSLLGKDLFNDFPNNLPTSLVFNYFGQRYVKIHEEIKKRELKIDNLDDREKIYDFHLSKLSTMNNSSKAEKILECIHQTSRYYLNMPVSVWPDFEGIRISQEIISSTSIAEGFIIDTVRQVIKCLQKLSYDEKKIYQLCNGSIGSKLKKIDKEFNLELKFSDKQKNDLEKLIIIRNLIIHNASKADEKWIRNFNTNVKIGDTIILESNVIEDLLDNLVDVMHELYFKVSTKYLKKEVNHIFPKLIDIEHESFT